MRKLLYFTLIVCIVMTMVIPSYAGKEEGKGLEQAIMKVKTVVVIPEDYKDFSYYSYEQETDWGVGTIWSLNWTNEDNKSSIYASVDWEGNLLYFEHYQRSDESGLAKVTREQAAIVSKEFLQKSVPDLAPYMREVDLEYSLQDNYRHVFQYKYYAEDIPASFTNVSIRVNKYTGVIESYSGLEAGFIFPLLPTAAGIIDVNKAKEAFLDEIGIQLVYKSYYTYKEKELNLFPAYRVGNSSKAIDAHTGELVDLFYGQNLYSGMETKDMNAAGMGDSQVQNLTREEQDAIDKLGKLLSKEAAAAKIIEQISLTLDSKDIKSASLHKDNIDEEKYIWQIHFDELYGSVDARSGELQSYHYYGDDREGKKDLTEDASREIAESFLQKIVPQKFSESLYIPDSVEYGIYIKEEKPSTYSFRYNRLVNGIEFVDNGFNVTVNRRTGDITYYNSNWFDKAVFPSLTDILTDTEMMEEMMKEYSFDTVYEKTGKNGDVDLIYIFEQTARTAIFDPFTGERISANGRPFESVKRPIYQDIKGHWSEKIVMELIENGYYLKTDNFHPDNLITQIDFFRYLFVPEMRYYDEEELYEMLINRDILKDEEKAPDSKMTRQDAAKFLIRYLGLGLAGERYEIYMNKFNDKVSEQYMGYASLCFGLGIMRGDGHLRFNGTKIMTNAEAASAIYNTLKLD